MHYSPRGRIGVGLGVAFVSVGVRLLAKHASIAALHIHERTQKVSDKVESLCNSQTEAAESGISRILI